MRFCTQCGLQQEGSESTCMRCGAPQSIPASVAIVPSAMSTAEQALPLVQLLDTEQDLEGVNGGNDDGASPESLACHECGSLIRPSQAFCTRCGTALASTMSIATATAESTSAPRSSAKQERAHSRGKLGHIKAPDRRCTSCGSPLSRAAVTCPDCGAAASYGKTKRTAVLLAVFLTFWTWLYTYARNRKRFWIGLAAAVVGTALATVVVGDFILFALWVWAVVDTATKPESYFRNLSA